MSESRCFDVLRAILDAEDKWWWTAYGLIALSNLAKTGEGRFWATFYERLCACQP